MRHLISFLFLSLSFSITYSYAQEPFVEVRPEIGEGSITLLQKYDLYRDGCSHKVFLELNQITAETELYRHKLYKLPIKKYEFNGISIRSTIGINDWDLATKIAAYNRNMNDKGLKLQKYQDDKALWVPIYLLDCPNQEAKAQLASSKRMVHFPAFGPKHASFEMIDHSLEGKVFYLVSGHGGPDPGAMCETESNTLCEDEYAYDVMLRLAKNLMSRGAEVEVVIQDPDDGIRSEPFLECDNDEVCSGGFALPLNQLKRLQQRTHHINNMYIKKRKGGNKEQYAVMIHVDSRSVNSNQDVYFYHLADSRTGKKMAKNLYQTFKQKYSIYRASGQYHGSVTSRNLYMLRSTYPAAVFIELGNLRNPHDQKRIIIENNRQALADWIYEGLAKL